MKKLAIAGASLALAAMPVLGVFAETTVKDTITVTVSSSCELADITPAGTSASNANNYYGTGNPGQLVTPVAGTKASPGTGTATSVRIACNDPDGYTVSASFTSLTGPGTAITYSSDPEAVAGNGKWTAYASKNSGAATAIAAATGLTGDSSMTDTYSFSYKVGLGNNQAAGDYTGDATYTLSGNPTQP